MSSQFPLQNNILFNQAYLKHNKVFNKSASLNSSPNHNKKIEIQNTKSSNQHTLRPSSFSISRQQQQKICLRGFDKLVKEAKMSEDTILEGVNLENKIHQNFQQLKLNKQKLSSKNELKKYESTSQSKNNKVIFGQILTNCSLQQDRKERARPKVPSFIKNTISKNQNFNELNLPLNQIQNNKGREVQTDRITKKEHALCINMPIPHNLQFKRQSSQNKDRIDLLKQVQLQENTNLGHPKIIRKQRTQDFILEVSNFPLNTYQSHQISKEYTQKQSFQSKKGNFQFFRKIKQKKKTCFIEPPKQFSLKNFSFIEKLGKGAFGDVFLAEQKITGFICVIKKLSKKKIKELKLEEQIERQIKIQSFLNHRHITSLYGFFDDQTHIYLILQLLPDGSLMQSKYRRKISQNEVSQFIRQIALGLSCLHTEKIIHRDLKPQNIFLFQTYAKIGDFGCSIYTSIFRNSQIGSLAYVSPEQLKQQFYNQKIDVWSLGIIAYEMLLGISPFQRDIVKITRKQMTAELLQLKFPQGASLSQQGRQFLTAVLNSDPKGRLGIQQVLRHEFILKYSSKQAIIDKQLA